MPDIGEELDKTAKAVERVSKPDTFAATMAIILMLAMSFMFYGFREDWREERRGNVQVLSEMVKQLKELNERVGALTKVSR